MDDHAIIHTLNEAIVKANQSGVQISTLLGDSADLRNFLHEQLRVAAGVQGFADQVNDRYVTLQSSQYSDELTRYRAIEIPRQQSRNRVSNKLLSEDLLDFLFLAFRSDRRLSEGPPEFLTPGNLASFPPTIGNFEREKKFPSSATEIALKRLDTNILLYVEAVETVFFLYGWRWLIRYAQEFGLSSTLDPTVELGTTSAASDASIWTSDFWSDLSDEEQNRLPEVAFIRSIQAHQKEVTNDTGGEPLTSRATFLKASLCEWMAISADLDAPLHSKSTTFSHDLKLIGLLDQNEGATALLKRLLVFAISEIQHLLDSGRSLPHETIDAIVILQTFSSQFVVGTSYTDIVRQRVESALRRVVLCLLDNSSAQRVKTAEVLESLHGVARLLVIPYFYQVSLLQCPLDHLVLGVWDSQKYALKWNVKGRTFNVPHVVHTLLGINDLWMDPCVLKSADKLEAVLNHIRSIHSFMQALARPLVDAGFYGGIIERSQINKGGKFTRDAFGHQIKPIATALRSKWVVDAEKLFDIECLESHSVAPGKIGKLLIDPKLAWLAKSIAVAPFKQIVTDVGQMMKLWAMVSSPTDLPTKQSPDSKTISLDVFANECMDSARNSLMPHALLKERVIGQLQTFKDLMGNLDGILRRQKLIVHDASEPGLRIGLAYNNSRDTVWLSRIFVVIFQSCLEHGDLLSPVEVSVTPLANKLLSIRVENVSTRSTEELRASVLAEYGADSPLGNLNEEEIDVLVNCVNNMRVGTRSVDGNGTHSKDVMTYCLREIAGELVKWPSADSPGTKAVTEFRCRYQLREIG